MGLQIFKLCVSSHSLQVTLLLEFCHILSVQPPKSFYSRWHPKLSSSSWLTLCQLVVTKKLPDMNIDFSSAKPCHNRYARLQESYPVSTMSAITKFFNFQLWSLERCLPALAALTQPRPWPPRPTPISKTFTSGPVLKTIQPELPDFQVQIAETAGR